MAGKFPNSGSLGRNPRKTQDNHPEYTGQAEIDGVDYWISAWLKDGKEGTKFFSLSFKPKEQQGSSAKPQQKPQQRQMPDDDDFDGAPF